MISPQVTIRYLLSSVVFSTVRSARAFHLSRDESHQRENKGVLLQKRHVGVKTSVSISCEFLLEAFGDWQLGRCCRSTVLDPFRASLFREVLTWRWG